MTVRDVICMAIPEGVDPEEFLGDPDPRVQEIFLEKLTDIARGAVWGQWRDQRAPRDVHWEAIEWMITADLEDVATFQPAHDCERCRAGNVKAEEYLREHPGQWIAMGNLIYTPVWEST